MKRTARTTLLALVFLALPTIAWSQAPPSPAPAQELDPATIVSPTVTEGQPAAEEIAAPDAALTPSTLLGTPEPLATTCFGDCTWSCEIEYNACLAGCGTPNCQWDCMFVYQSCYSDCYIYC